MGRKDGVIELLEELVKWTRVSNIPHVKALLMEILQSPEEKVVRCAKGDRLNCLGNTKATWENLKFLPRSSYK